MTVSRRDVLKAAIAAPVLAAFPWYRETEDPLAQRMVGWEAWHGSVVLNSVWCARIPTEEQFVRDYYVYGTAAIKDGKRVAPTDLLA